MTRFVELRTMTDSTGTLMTSSLTSSDRSIGHVLEESVDQQGHVKPEEDSDRRKGS